MILNYKGNAMISGINNIQQSASPLQFTQRLSPTTETTEPLNSFADEDEAIISSQAKLQNELEKFNSGEGDALDLAVAGIMAKTTISAEVNVINAKKHMMDDILDIGKNVGRVT